MEPAPPPGTGDLLVRALRVLEALAGMEQPATLPAVTARVRLPRSQTYRSLRSLEQAGYIDHVPRAGYRTGARALTLGSLLGPRPELRQRTRPVLTRLAAETSAVATLHMRSGFDRVLLLGEMPPDAGRWSHQVFRPGERACLTRGCSGRVILAHLPAEEIDAMIRERGDTPRARAAAGVLARIRQDGFELSFSDNHERTHGVSMPLLDPEDGAPLGSLSLSGAAERLDEAALRELLTPLRAAVARLGPLLAAVLGPHASARLGSLDVEDLLAAPG